MNIPSANWDYDMTNSFHHGFSLSERIGWVCRILFQRKGNKPLRAVGLGEQSTEALFVPEKNWPLYPVLASGSSYFVPSEGYIMGGWPESIPDYLIYCRKNGTFLRVSVPVPTQVQALQDLKRLEKSRAWRSIQWGPRYGQSYSGGEIDVRDYMKDQIPLW